MSRSKTNRSDHIVSSALALFLVNGLRGTSMEAIARQAGVAKPTLYKYFSDKDAVFEAVANGVFTDMRKTAEKAMTGSGDASERVARALGAKHKIIFKMLEGSPHAAELYAAPKVTNNSALVELENWMLSTITEALLADGHSDAQKLAQLCNACADGIARHAKHAEEIGPAIRLVVRRICSV